MGSRDFRNIPECSKICKNVPGGFSGISDNLRGFSLFQERSMRFQVLKGGFVVDLKDFRMFPGVSRASRDVLDGFKWFQGLSVAFQGASGVLGDLKGLRWRSRGFQKVL